MSKICLPLMGGITILCTLTQSISVLAKPVQNNTIDFELVPLETSNLTSQLAQIPAQTTGENRVTSVSQLSDVQPTELGFSSFAIAGRTLRGNCRLQR